MIKFSIDWSFQFVRELDEIYNFLYYSYQAPQTAKRFYSKVKDFISRLDLFPEGYPKVYGSKRIQSRNLRKILVNNYIIIYEVDTYNHKVSILHIFHGSQNYLCKI